MSSKTAGWIFGCLLVLAAPIGVKAQTPDGADRGAIRLFLDCQGRIHCDMDFLRREIRFVDFMRDRQDADVHVLGVSQNSGGGQILTFSFIGLRDFDSVTANYDVAVSSTDTSDEQRRKISRTLQMGLMEFVARTPAAERIQITYEAPETNDATALEEQKPDPWNFWVFRIGANGFTFGESRQSFLNYSGSVNASRVTDDWKIVFGSHASKQISDFTFSDGTTLHSTQESYGWNGLVVSSINSNWSFGFAGDVNSSTYSNTKIQFQFYPAVEFNAFPYDESSRQSLIFRYGIGVRAVAYNEVTIYDKTEETLPEHVFAVQLQQNQPWGRTSIELNAAQVLSDLSKYQVGVYGNLNIRLVRGLDLRLNGSYSKINNQLSLPRGGATDEEVLLRRQQLETNYRYNGSFGLSYRFGSIFNNIVNPRMRGIGGGGGGGEVFFF
ncbi:MAG: hypothetical protein OEZ54_06610 [Gemmatimonadota bacterium]|nr:hypothetical protein [Gemmatimonadota bacterium]